LEKRGLAKWGYSLQVFYKKKDATNRGRSLNETSTKTTSLQVYYQNVRGLRTKTNELYASILAEEYDLIVLAETWLTDGFHNAELFDNRYHVVRADRSYGRRGGGVLVAAEESEHAKCKTGYS